MTSLGVVGTAPDGISGDGASGWEVATSIAGTAPDGQVVTDPVEPASNDRGAPPPGTVVLATGINPPGCGADMVAYIHDPGGGLVFSASSVSFGGSLLNDAALQQILRNVLDEGMGRGLKTATDREAGR
ncbi:hypothetical protein [Nocardia sp. NPDC059228]|uniref:hypothetical protein n=1 Tax=Nocardia sp. NPDC059228 TaxID=3346777 RepID=UPI0036A16453